MPAEFTFFVESDFDEHQREILSMCEDVLGELVDVYFERTPAPLGEGENGVIAYVSSRIPVPSITNKKVHHLESKLQEHFGILSLKVRSICPVCKKNLHDHYGYFQDTPHTSLNMCDACGMKAYKKKERRQKLTCPTCSTKFIEEENDARYTMALSFWLDDEKGKKDKRVAKVDHRFSRFDAVAFCSKRCVQLKLDSIIKELAAINNQL